MATREIPLTRGYVAIVDEEDHDRVTQFKWSAKPTKHTIYAARSKSKTIPDDDYYQMHRMVMNVIDSKVFVDHIDGNGLNNTKANLRLATNGQNQARRKQKEGCSSKYRGVSKTKHNTWNAYISHNNKYIYLGVFKTEAQAALAYNKAAEEIHGEFAGLNIIESTDDVEIAAPIHKRKSSQQHKKNCKDCGVEKTIDNTSVRMVKGRTYFNSECKSCRKAYMKKYHEKRELSEADRQKKAEHRKAWAREYMRDYRKKHSRASNITPSKD